jgi:hypothetical protein
VLGTKSSQLGTGAATPAPRGIVVRRIVPALLPLVAARWTLWGLEALQRGARRCSA